jgi:hypothetical protein
MMIECRKMRIPYNLLIARDRKMLDMPPYTTAKIAMEIK